MIASAATRQRWIAAHCEQSRSESCVPACAAMVMAMAHSLEVDAIAQLEAEYIARWGLWRGVPIGRVTELGLTHRYERDFAAMPEDAMAALADRLHDGPVIVGVWIGPLRHAQGGTGWQPSDRLLHAIVLAGHERRRFLYLDPAHPRSHQPLAISYAHFIDAWTGEFAFLSPS